MKGFLICVLMIVSMACSTQGYSQDARFATVRLSGHMDIKMKVPSMDDAGFGLQLDAALFAREKVRPLLTTHLEHLLGDKQYIISNTGRVNKRGTIYGIQAGPEWIVRPWLGLTMQYGVFWHSVQAFGFSADDGLRLGARFMPGKNKRFGVHISRNTLFLPGNNIRYHNVGVGYRIF